MHSEPLLTQQYKRRAIYAAALGIDSWVPRKPLPGANIHNVWQFTAAKPGITLPDKKTSTPQQPAPSNRRSSSRAAALAKAIDSEGHVAARAVTAHTDVNGSTHEKPSGQHSFDAFELCAILHDDILLVDDITGLALTASAYQDWLNAIFIAIRRRPFKRSLHGGDRLSWPASMKAGPDARSFKGSDHATSPSAASEMTLAWLYRKIESTGSGALPVSKLILMGNVPQRLLLEQPNGSKPADATLASLSAVCVASSRMLWMQPVLKRELWQQLQIINV